MKSIQKIIMLLLFIGTFTMAVTLHTTGIYAPNKNITVQISNQAADHKNWIGIYHRGSSNAWANVISWKWTNGNNSVDMGGLPDGSYEARLFYNNSFNLEATTYIEVDTNPATIETSKPIYTINENIIVNTGEFNPELEAWVGLYPAGSSNDWDNVLEWCWAKTNEIVLDSLAKGKYEARLFFHNSFTLEASYVFEVGDNTPNIHTTSTQYTVNEKISVVVNGARAGQKDWVGIFSKNDNNSWANVYAWSFVEDGTTVLDESRKNMPAGDYEIRLFFNNEYGVDAEVRASYGFKIVGGVNNDKVYPPETTLTSKVVNSIQRPAHKLDTYIDTAFNDGVTRTVTRVTDREHDNKGMNGHQYPKQGSAWNSDMSLLRLTGRIYDAETLEEIPLTKDKHYSIVNTLMKAPKNGVSGIRWSKHNPHVLYVIGGDNKFYELTINADRTAMNEREIIDLSKEAQITNFTLGHDEGNIDYDDKYVVLSATRGHDIYVALLDIQEKRLVWKSKTKKLPYTKEEFDWVSISPSGKYILVSASSNGKNQIDLYDAKTFTLIKEKFTTSAQHGDIGQNSLRQDVYVQWEQNGYSAYNLETKKTIQLLDFKVGTAHVSCRNYNRPGWCYVSPDSRGYKEVFALKLDGSKVVQRFAKIYAKDEHDLKIDDNEHKQYFNRYQMGIPSPDGTRILFRSDYGNPENFLYYTEDWDNAKQEWKWHTTEHLNKIDTYEVRISK